MTAHAPIATAAATFPGRFANKVAIVTGAAQGIGRAVAERLAAEGGKVVAVDRSDIVQELAEVGALPVIADLETWEGAEAAIGAALGAHGRLDILINNVGIGGGGDAPAHRLEEKAFDRIMSVNLKGMWLTIKAAIPPMREQGGGAIVNISSLAAASGATQMAYEVSKAAVNRLTTSVAQSNARHGIRANAIMMGFMDTPMAVTGIAQATKRSTADVRAERDARVPLRGKMGTGWDTAYAALYLASDEAGFVTGEILRVDGGMGLGAV
jgi:NAD(P)-dependent dehydrogenase (short-subunit alcohol dehydrogenase family)